MATIAQMLLNNRVDVQDKLINTQVGKVVGECELLLNPDEDVLYANMTIPVGDSYKWPGLFLVTSERIILLVKKRLFRKKRLMQVADIKVAKGRVTPVLKRSRLKVKGFPELEFYSIRKYRDGFGNDINMHAYKVIIKILRELNPTIEDRSK